MCNLESGFTTVVGPVGDMEDVALQWSHRIRPPFEGVMDPEFRALGSGDATYRDSGCPAVLTIRHDPLLGGLVADYVERAITNFMPLVRSVTEPGYYLQTVTSAGIGLPGARSVSVSTANLGRVVVHAPPVAPGSGRVAVIDTGDGQSQGTVTDFTTGPTPAAVQPVDTHGHGSAVAQLIRDYNPHATIESLRVCTGGLAASVELYLALTYALWPRGRYDVVNVSLSTQLSGACATPLGKTITAITQWCTSNRGGLDVHLVAAAGNKPQKFGYPAAVPGAIVVEALDWNGQAAVYNTPVPMGCRTAQASGGESLPGASLGTVTLGVTSTQIVGTSFAAALVSAQLAH